MIELFIPGLVPKTTINSRIHWSVRARRAKAERTSVTLLLRRSASKPTPPLLVTLTRCSTGKPDSDAAWTAMKSVRDGVADWLGIDDGDDEKVTWNVERLRVKRDEQGTRIRIERRAA